MFVLLLKYPPPFTLLHLYTPPVFILLLCCPPFPPPYRLFRLEKPVPRHSVIRLLLCGGLEFVKQGRPARWRHPCPGAEPPAGIPLSVRVPEPQAFKIIGNKT